MYQQNEYDPYDLLSLDECGMDGDGRELVPWDQYGLTGFGSMYGTLGAILDPGVQIEIHPDDDLGDGTVRTPMLELSPFDYEYFQTVGFGYPGMMALSDEGAVYEYEPASDGALSGWFRRKLKKIGRKVKKGLKAVGRGIKKGAKVAVKHGKKVIKRKLKALTKGPFSATMDKWKNRINIGKKLLSKTKWGRAAIKIGNKVLKTGMKIVKPLAKHVGKWAPRLAPVAALIPGVGPAISGAMLSAGQVANTINKYGAQLEAVLVTDKKTGKTKKVNRLRVDPKKRKSLISALKRSAAKMQKVPAYKRAAMLKQLRAKDPARYSRPIRQPSRASMATAIALAKQAAVQNNAVVNRRVQSAAAGNRVKAQRIKSLIQQLNSLGYRVA